ncbi:unnamed protein product [Lota lota]
MRVEVLDVGHTPKPRPHRPLTDGKRGQPDLRDLSSFAASRLARLLNPLWLRSGAHKGQLAVCFSVSGLGTAEEDGNMVARTARGDGGGHQGRYGPTLGKQLPTAVRLQSQEGQQEASLTQRQVLIRLWPPGAHMWRDDVIEVESLKWEVALSQFLHNPIGSALVRSIIVWRALGPSYRPLKASLAHITRHPLPLSL